MHCLLLGNGLNRLSMPLSWHQLLECLALELGLGGEIAVDDHKPLTLHFEELCARLSDYGKTSKAENAVKKRIAKLIQAFPVHRLHRDLANLFQVILTTNYDFTIEDALAGGLRERQTKLPESRYSLFRRVEVGSHAIWHIHGDADQPSTILLGYDDYAGYLQKIRNYLTKGVPTDLRIKWLRSPLRSGIRDFETHPIHSWVDHFLRDHVHVVGFGFDFTEIDLWWLLVHKRRRPVRTGETFIYLIDIDGNESERQKVKLALFASLGATPVIVRADSYEAGYGQILEAIAANITSHPSWLAEPTNPPSEEMLDVPDPPSEQVPNRPEQLELPVKKRQRSRAHRPT